MKKAALILIFAILCISVSYASETDVKKVKVTRHKPTAFVLDLGAMLSIPMSDAEKGGGIFASGTVSPVELWKLSCGFKFEGSIFASKDILNSGNKKKYIQVQLLGLFIANYPLAKSFEIYGGAGAFYTIKEINKLNDFGQTCGLAFQGGGRGRANDWFGVGAEINYVLNLTGCDNAVDAKAYISLEF